MSEATRSKIAAEFGTSLPNVAQVDLVQLQPKLGNLGRWNEDRFGTVIESRVGSVLSSSGSEGNREVWNFGTVGLTTASVMLEIRMRRTFCGKAR